MKTLVLCVDRDDDLGVKAKIKSPVIGRKANLKAAVALGLADPEDSDVNVLLMGLKKYQEYKDMGREVELATICGDKNVGIKSDANLMSQFLEVVSRFTPDTVVLVSDGAEDEYVVPMISARYPVEHISRVVVKQKENIESTIYILMSALKEPKVKNRLITPLAVSLLLLGVLTLFNMVYLAYGAILTFLGIYLIIWVFNLRDTLSRMALEIRVTLRSRRYVFITATVLSMIPLLVVLYIGWDVVRQETSIVLFLYHFFKRSVWYLIGAGIIYVLGNALDVFLRTGKVLKSSLTLTMLLLTVGFFVSAFLTLSSYLIGQRGTLPTGEFSTYSLLGVLLAATTLLMRGTYKERMATGGKVEAKE
ncbi:MAG: DUF373 family protein [Thermoplasmata archaeon]|nr:DUF373 family protein [Thermoplasmata archaeon]RLF71547.1 MAG: hypothetical protein DRN40_02215 [Thermoplasmata archaeon]